MTGATPADSPASAASASAPPTSDASTTTPQPVAQASAVDSPPAIKPQQEETASEDPWIESVLCTSCNDCLQINAKLFVYNDNKQALIGDPHSGTFEQLVIAAEKCPAHCIHPGTPLNKQEAKLESLIQRAAPFN